MNAPVRDLGERELSAMLDEVAREVARRRGFAPVGGEVLRVTLSREVPPEVETGTWSVRLGGDGWSVRVEAVSMGGARSATPDGVRR